MMAFALGVWIGALAAFVLVALAAAADPDDN